MVLERLMTESKRISLLSRRDLFIVYCMTGFLCSVFLCCNTDGNRAASPNRFVSQRILEGGETKSDSPPLVISHVVVYITPLWLIEV